MFRSIVFSGPFSIDSILKPQNILDSDLLLFHVAIFLRCREYFEILNRYTKNEAHVSLLIKIVSVQIGVSLHCIKPVACRVQV